MAGKHTTHFDRWAAHYDDSRYQARLFQPLHVLTLREVVREMPTPRSVLDLGCGTGQFLRRAATILPGAELVGVDASAEMARAAREAAGDGESIRFVHAVAEALPLRDGSFDVVVTTASFHHWTDQARALEEVSRVLRPGGVFVLSDVLAAGALRVGLLTRFLGRRGGGRFNTPDALDAMLSAAGLEVVRRTPLAHSGRAVQVTVARRRFAADAGGSGAIRWAGPQA